MSKSYDVLSDRQVSIVIESLQQRKTIAGITSRSRLISDINEIISYFENYNSAFNPLDHE